MTEIVREVSSAKHGNAKWGCVPVGAEPTRVWHSVKEPLTRGCLLAASKNNVAPIHIGYGPEVTADESVSGGLPLSPGDGLNVPVDDLADIWVVSTVPNQKLYFQAV